jgi:hypothetical protein
VWWLGVFIAPTTKVVVGEGFCRMAHRTVRCATGHCPVRQPRHPAVGFRPLELLTCGPLDSPVVHRTGPVHCPVRHLTPALTSARAGVHCSISLFLCRRPLALFCRYSAGAPDSPVNYSGVAPRIPEAGKFRVNPPWCTGHCPVAHRIVRCARPGLPSVVFCSFYLNPFFDFVLVCVEPLAPVELIIQIKLVSPIICVGQFNHQNHLGKGVSLFPFQSPPFW